MASVIRLIGALLAEINEMIAAERRYIAELTEGTAELTLPAAPRT
jgi:hypothetical protein